MWRWSGWIGCTATPVEDVVSALVYSAQPDDVDTVIIDGELVMQGSEAVDD